MLCVLLQGNYCKGTLKERTEEKERFLEEDLVCLGGDRRWGGEGGGEEGGKR